jgi:ATP-dependent helicase Lhr and Lhr-like helicase
MRARRELVLPPNPRRPRQPPRALLTRYGVVFRKLLEREDALPTWRELFCVYRRPEATGEILGGWFVSGFSAEQFALSQAAKPLGTGRN